MFLLSGPEAGWQHPKKTAGQRSSASGDRSFRSIVLSYLSAHGAGFPVGQKPCFYPISIGFILSHKVVRDHRNMA